MSATQKKNKELNQSNVAIVPTDSGLLIRKLAKQEVTKNGIYLPQRQKDRDESARAEIVAVGPGRLDPRWAHRGFREPMDFRPGERIIYRLHAGTTVIHMGEELAIIDASEVVCKEVDV